METADAVVIGGGCVGVSTAYHLTSLGCTGVLLVEAGELGSGSTGKGAGGVRLQYSDELNVRIMLRSIEKLERFAEVTGKPLDLRQVGYLFLLGDEAELAAFRRAAALQRSLGVATVELDAAAAGALVPPLATDGILGATYCPREGYTDARAVVDGYVAAARRGGARIETGRRVTRILVTGGAVTGVETSRGPVATRAVVCAAGVGSRLVAATAGVDLPVTGAPRWMHACDADAGVPDGAPLTIDFPTGFYFHRRGPGLVFGGREVRLTELMTPATRRLPSLASVPVTRSWWGEYDMSPDHNAMIGRSAVPGLAYATGFSGHGFQQSPAAGEHLAEIVLGRPPTLDLGALSADRFALGTARTEGFWV